MKKVKAKVTTGLKPNKAETIAGLELPFNKKEKITLPINPTIVVKVAIAIAEVE